MAEVKKNNRTNSNKSSEVLNETNKLSNEELLDQIITKKKTKTKNTNSSIKKISNTQDKKNISKQKKVENNKNEISSDDIYEQIKSKKTNKKKTKKSSTKVNEKNNEHKESLSVDKEKVNVNNNIEEIDKTLTIEEAEARESVITEDNSIDNNGELVIEGKKEIVDEITKSEESETEDKKPSKEDDLIITRQICFDDDFINLKDKNTLKELKDAIENFDKLDGDNFKVDDDFELLPSVKYSNYKLKKRLVIIGAVLLIVLFILLVILGMKFIDNNKGFSTIVDNTSKVDEEAERVAREALLKRQMYDTCINRDDDEVDMTEEMNNAIITLDKYLEDNYSTSVVYKDLNRGFSYEYKPDKVYYAASTIKSLEALYIYSKADAGEISLDDTVTYSKKFDVSYSYGMKKKKYGTKVSLRELVKYSVIYSDNSAHQMLVSYIGRSKLKEYGKSLGAKNTLNGGDNFGNLSAADGAIYMKNIYDYLETNTTNAQELKQYFIESEQKDLSVNNLIVANKYGLYKANYHNIGVVYDESPYVVSILTLEGNKNKEKKLNDISQHIYDLHILFKTNREKVCQSEVYGQ